MKTRIALLMAIFLAFAIALPVHARTTFTKHDKEFATKAARDNLLEIELGKVAEQQAQAPEVKEFGTMIATDHGKANDELKEIAQRKNLTLPAELGPKGRKKVDELKKETGAKFDRMFMKDMVKDHTSDVKAFKKAIPRIKDPELKTWAENTLSGMKQHLKKAKATAKLVKAEK
ncbi:MAG: DUF4142 domain-containing protein [Desulfobacteraceae bacterium]|nr:DUF4142 domain-containing protein [Desulfobacteraceae bacterium]